MGIRLIKGLQLREDAALRQSFFELAEQSFDLPLAQWYERGFWTEAYLPYALADGQRILANISVNKIDLLLMGAPRRYLQLGTVMTAPSHRGQGLARHLMRQVLSDWQNSCDALYLYANASVLEFYPKFGFARAFEHEHALRVAARPGDFAPIDPLGSAGQALLRRCYQKGNPFSLCSMPHNLGLVMFYCGSFLRSCALYSPRRDALCIAEPAGPGLLCYDIFCDPGQDLPEILGELSARDGGQVRLGFTPKNASGLRCAPILEDDDALFIYKGGENPFEEHRLRLPLLSHA